jgi:hypothetical protein
MKSPNLMTHGKKIAALAVMLSLTAPAANAASGPFARMAGAWSGDGRPGPATGGLSYRMDKSSASGAGPATMSVAVVT